LVHRKKVRKNFIGLLSYGLILWEFYHEVRLLEKLPGAKQNRFRATLVRLFTAAGLTHPTPTREKKREDALLSL
jgi:hypothetical protein